MAQRALVVLGFGSVSKCSLGIAATWKDGELLRRLGVVQTTVVVKDLTDADRTQLAGWGMAVINTALTKSTFDGVLTPLFTAAEGRAPTLVINLTTGVNSLDIVKLAQRCGALCIDSSASEYWPEEEDEMEGQFQEEGSNYMCREEYLQYAKSRPAGSPTALTCCGANPGMVTFFLKRALAHLWSQEGTGTVESAGGFGVVAQKLGVRCIHIAERDTQVPITPRIPLKEFTNTWSVDGFILEGSKQAADVGWGTHERALPPNGSFYSSGCGASIRIAEPSASVRCLTWVPTFGEQVGCCVTHYETTSIANLLTVKNASKEVVYRPTVHYAYHPCEESLEAFAEIAAANWDPNIHPIHRVWAPDEIQDGGCDELGVLLMRNRDNGTIWYGSTVYNEEAKVVAPNTQATSIQVAAGVLAGCLWMVGNPNRGPVEPEDIEDYESVLNDAAPFLGKLHYAEGSWTPRGGDPTDDATWQFGNFRIIGTYDPRVARVAIAPYPR